MEIAFSPLTGQPYMPYNEASKPKFIVFGWKTGTYQSSFNLRNWEVIGTKVP